MALACLAGRAAVAHAQQTVVTLDPAQTKINFSVEATLHTVHGTFRMKSGEIRFDPATGKASGSIVVDATSGNSDNESRDRKMHKEVLQSDKFADLVFTPVEVRGKIAPQGNSEVEVPGSIRLLGKDHELTLKFAVQSGNGHDLQATAHFSVPYKKWGLKNPSNFLLHVSDSVDVEVQAVGRVAAGPAPR